MRNIYIYILIILISFNIFGQTKQDELINRTIVILPAYNMDKNPANNNLVTAIRDALRAKLTLKNMFNIVSFSEIDNRFKEYGYTEEDFLNEEKMINLAKSLNGDVVLMTKFLVVGDDILIISSASDIFVGQITVSSFIDGELGIEVFKYVNKITEDMANKMAKKFSAIDKSKVNELLKAQTVIIEEEDKEVINRLLKRKDKYKKLVLKRGKEEIILAIPHGKNIVIFIGDKNDNYTVQFNEEILQSKNGIKIVMLDNSVGKTTKFSLNKEGFKTLLFDYKQKKDYEIYVKNISFVK